MVAMLSGDIPPNQTIYIKNLNEKVKKEGEICQSFSNFPFDIPFNKFLDSSSVISVEL